MKQLIILRHAKSSWNEPDRPDHERRLSARGERDAPQMGARLHAQGARPSLIITSDAARALATAEIVAHALDYPRTSLRIEPALYLAAPATILAVIGAQDDSHESLLIVGHNPGLTELANQLLPELALDNLPTAGVIGVGAQIERWSQLAAAPTTLTFYDYPKK